MEESINVNSNINKNKKKVFIDNKTRLLLLKKIKLTKFPQLSQNLDDFFWNSEKYFQPIYEDHIIIVGNNQNKTKPRILKRKITRKQSRKMIAQSLRISSDKKKLADGKTDITSPRIEKKKGINKIVKEIGLKKGQKYIDDLELEELFNKFKTVQKINRKKSNNFIMAKEYIDNKNYKLKKSPGNSYNKFLESKKSQTIETKKDYKIFPYLDKNEGGESQISYFKKNINNVNNDYYKTISTFMSLNNINNEKENNKKINKSPRTNNIFSSSTNINFLNTDYNNYINNDKKSKTAKNFYHIRTFDEDKKVISRNHLIRRQNQFLLNNTRDSLSINKGQRTIYAKLLANQEQAIMQITKNQTKSKNLFKTLSQKTHRPKKDLLITNIESYRIKNELKDRFVILKSRLAPEHAYNWTNDLRSSSNLNKDINKNNEKNDQNKKDLFNIRDPYNKTMYNMASKKNLGKKKEIKYFKNIIDESNSINNNLEGLFIKGENLLKKEYDQVKDIKNKMIINNYEMFLPPSDVEDILFTDKKYLNKNKNEEKNNNKISNNFLL